MGKNLPDPYPPWVASLFTTSKGQTMKRILITALVVLSCSFLFTSCAGIQGRGARYHYWYYPTAGVYFDYQQKVYYYPDNGGWKKSEQLPQKFSSDPTHVEVEGDQDKPYSQIEDHRRQYPAPQTGNVPNSGHRDDKNNETEDKDTR